MQLLILVGHLYLSGMWFSVVSRDKHKKNMFVYKRLDCMFKVWLRVNLYMARGRPERHFEFQVFNPQTRSNIMLKKNKIGQPCCVEWTRSRFQSWCSWRGTLMKRIILSWIDSKDVYYPMDKVTMAHLEFVPRKTLSQFFEVGPKIYNQFLPLRTPHRRIDVQG